MPKRNYGFEKRQKELNKQRKREAKEQRKLDRSKGVAGQGPPEHREESGSTPEA